MGGLKEKRRRKEVCVLLKPRGSIQSYDGIGPLAETYAEKRKEEKGEKRDGCTTLAVGI